MQEQGRAVVGVAREANLTASRIRGIRAQSCAVAVDVEGAVCGATERAQLVSALFCARSAGEEPPV